MAAFNLLLNRPVTASVAIPDTLVPLNTEGIATLEVWRDSLRGNPLFEQLELQRNIADERLNLNARQGMPSLGFGMDYIIVGKRTDMELPDNGKDAMMPMVTLRLPLWRNRYSSVEREVQHQLEAIDQNETALQNDLLTQLERNSSALSIASRKIELYRKLIANTQIALEVLVSAYTSDQKDFEEVIRIELRLLNYQVMLIEAKASQQKSLAELQYLTGQIGR